jgi:hypothetical protein
MNNSLISTKRIITPSHQVGPSWAKELADLMELTEGNATPLYVKNVGTIINAQYELIQPHNLKQVGILAAARVLRDRNLQKWEKVSVIITNPTNNEGEIIDMTDAILAQL